MHLPIPLAFAIEQGIATALKLDPHTKQALSQIDGKVIRVEVTSPRFEFHLIVVDNEIEVEGEFDAEPDTTISGSAGSLLSLQEKTDALYSGEVKISGELETADRLKQILSNIDIDLEDAIAPITGDAMARQLGRFGTMLTGWLGDTSNSLKRNTSEYLQEEAEILAPNSEVKRFNDEVEEVREQADRIEARLAVLMRKHDQDKSES